MCLVHLLPAYVLDVVATVGGGGGTYVLILVPGRAPGLARVRVLGLVLDRALGPHGLAGGAIRTSPRGTADTVEGVEVGLGLVEEVEGEADAVDIVRTPSLVHRHVGVLGPHADGHQATSVADMEGAEQGRLHTLCVLVAHGRDLTLVLALHVLGRGRAPCLTLPTRGPVGAGAGVARVLDL